MGKVFVVFCIDRAPAFDYIPRLNFNSIDLNDLRFEDVDPLQSETFLQD